MQEKEERRVIALAKKIDTVARVREECEVLKLKFNKERKGEDQKKIEGKAKKIAIKLLERTERRLVEKFAKQM